MAESVTFWLDNKNSTGIKAGALGNQVLVHYRERFYVVVNGAALTKGGRPLRYSQTSLPAVWKKALRGEVAPITASQAAEPPEPAITTATRRVSVKKVKEEPVMPTPAPIAPVPEAPPVQAKPQPPKTPKPAGKPASQSLVPADCPYCSQKHEIPVEKGRSGKPFFHVCTRCHSDFAVRFVQVTMYQAQVAGFGKVS